MEGDLQPLYLLMTDCYIYLLRKGNQQKNNVHCIVFGNALCNLLESNTFALVFFHRCNR